MERYEDPDRARKYLYRSENLSLVDRFMKRWWALAIKAVPATASANLVSMVGNAGSWAALALLCGLPFGPLSEAGPGRPWIFAVVAACIFFYTTLDALDGLQARRTGSSGPLGEFVDHWFDAFNAFFLPLGFAAAFPVVPLPLALAGILLCCFADWIVLLEVKMSNLLRFWYFSTEEGLYGMVVVYLCVGLFGYEAWSSPLPALGMSPALLVYLVFLGGIVLGGLSSLWRLRGAGSLRLLAMAASLAPIIAWTLLAAPRHGRAAFLAGGLLLGFSASRFVGDLLRSRLVGLKAPLGYLDLLALDALLLASLLLPALPAWLAPGAALAWTAFRLLRQFSLTLAKVGECLGIGLFGPLAAVPASAVPASAVPASAVPASAVTASDPETRVAPDAH